MPLCPACTNYVAGQQLTAATLNADFTTRLLGTLNTYVVFTDVARTVSVTHSYTATQTFTGGWTAAAACSIATGGLTVTLGGIIVTGTSSITGNTTITGTLGGLTGLTVVSGGATITAGTLALTAGNLTMADGNLALASGQMSATEFDAGNGGAAVTVNWNNSQNQKVTLTSGGCTLTMTNPVDGTFYRLRLMEDATGSRAFPTFSPTYSNITPAVLSALTATALHGDILVFYYINAKYYLVQAWQDVS